MQLSLSSVWPDFSALLNNPGSSEGISAFFCALILGVFVVFCVDLGIKCYSSFKNISSFRKMLASFSPEDMVGQQRALKDHPLKSWAMKNLWLEFDHTLVVSPDAERLSSTHDAAHFFNASNLARNVTESRLLAAVPGFLTAIGVIGTFLGLQLGLGALTLNTGDASQLKAAIAALISSASIAFITSVWGVSGSLIFNYIEKTAESRIRNEISSLQQRIDELFPRLLPEQTLLDISRSGNQSKETLMGLAEQIGHRMQTAVHGMAENVTKGMTEGLERLMLPAIEQMVGASSDLANKQATSSENALKSLLDKFMDGMGKAGVQQQIMIQQAASDMNRSIAEWSRGLTQFMSQMNQAISRLEDMSEQQGRSLSDQINQSLCSQKENTEYATNQMKGMAENLMDSVKSHHQQVAISEQQRLEHLTQHMEKSAKSQAEELKKLSDSSHAVAEEFQSTMKHSMEMLMADYQARQEAVANSDLQRQSALDLKVAQLTEMVNGSFGDLLKKMDEQQQGAASADIERQVKLTAVLERFIKNQQDEFGHTLEQATSVNEQFTKRVQDRMSDLAVQDQQRNLEMRNQIEGIQAQMASVVDDMRSAMDGHMQSVKAVIQQAEALNAGIDSNQKGLNSASENMASASLQIAKASDNLLLGHKEVARATNSLSGTLDFTASTVENVSLQNESVAESLQNTLAGLEKLQSTLRVISDDIRSGAENANSASRELATNHARYRQEMQDTIGSLHEQLGELLRSYAKQVEDQTQHRMGEWNRHTQEYVTGMSGVVSVMQNLVDDMDSRNMGDRKKIA